MTKPGIESEKITIPDRFEYTIFDYEVFKIDELGFGFIIADLELQSNVSLNLSLSHLSTSEGIYLSAIDDYLLKLSEASYSPGNRNLSFSIQSQESKSRFYLFIPYKNLTLSTLRLKSELNPYTELSFDLTDISKIKDNSLIKLNTEEVTVSDNLEVEINYVDVFDPTNFYTLNNDGTALSVEFSSSERVYGISLNILNNSEVNYKISDIYLIIDDLGEYRFLNPDILLMGTSNISKLNLINEVSGFTFFTLPKEQINLLSHDASKVRLRFVFTNGEEMIVEDVLKWNF